MRAHNRKPSNPPRSEQQRGVGQLSSFLIAALLFAPSIGCQLIPDVAHQPVVHNPFPQLSRVAIAPFFNHSDDETVDGRQFALAYYAELQAIPGFEVVPVSVVEEAMRDHRIGLDRPGDARRLAKILGVDAIAIGAVTDFSPYYPPRCGLRVEWYAANAGFHAIPPGYGLPWGTPDEEFIPAPLVFEAEMALAREQLNTQTPCCLDSCDPSAAKPAAGSGTRGDSPPPVPTSAPTSVPTPGPGPSDDPATGSSGAVGSGNRAGDPFAADEAVQLAQALESAPAGKTATGSIAAAVAPVGDCDCKTPAPPWPDERGFIPPGPSPTRPKCVPQNGPIMTHTRIYHGNDGELSEALASYFHFRDDARFGGWQSYLQRSDDFIRFCCHMHIAEMLSARGGAGETRVVWRWSENR